MQNASDYSWWKKNVGVEDPEHTFEALPCGFFRFRWGSIHQSTLRFVPVAIWKLENGEYQANFDGSGVNPERLREWIAEPGLAIPKTAICVSFEDYNKAIEERVWPGGFNVDVLTNNPPNDVEALREEIEELASRIKRLAEKKELTRADADQLANWKALAVRLEKQSEAMRKAEQDPHDKAVKDVRMKYRPLTEAASAAKILAARILGDWIQAEEKKKREELAKQIQAGEPVNIEETKVRVGGSDGRRVALRTQKYVEFTDYENAVMFFVKSGNAELKALVEKLAGKALAISPEGVPGAILKTKKVAA